MSYFSGAPTRKGLIDELTKGWENNSGEYVTKCSCLAHCYRGGIFKGVLWSVWENTFHRADGTEHTPPQRYIRCDAMDYTNDGKNFWGYKPMDETMGPFYYSCPIKYLDMVPIAIHGGHPEWRDTVRRVHQASVNKMRKKREATKQRKLAHG